MAGGGPPAYHLLYGGRVVDPGVGAFRDGQVQEPTERLPALGGIARRYVSKTESIFGLSEKDPTKDRGKVAETSGELGLATIGR